MNRNPLILLVLTTLALPAASPVLAEWPNDPNQNMPIAERVSEQVLPKIAVTSNGGCYVAWFDHASGNYDVYLQRLDETGLEQWPHNGILLSDHAQLTSLVDWQMIVDADDHAVLVFTDSRAGSDLDVYAYRVDPDGNSVWGEDGIALSVNDDFEPSPNVAELSGGGFVFAWARLPDESDGSIQIQKVTADGIPQFDPPLAIPGGVGESPAFTRLVGSEDGGFIVSYLRDISTFFSPRHIRAQKFDTFGTPLWGSEPISVFDAVSVPIGYNPHLLPDGTGGAIFGWHRSDGSFFNSLVQHVDADGTERFPHNGVPVSLQPNVHHLDPTFGYDPVEEEIFVFWNTRNPNQSQWGISAQKISSEGSRAWTDNGTTLLPIDAIWDGLSRCVVNDGGAIVLFFNEPTGNQLQDRILAYRLAGDGTLLWGEDPVALSAILSNKSRLPIAITQDGTVLAVWEDDRNGTVDVFGQNLNPDGSLGWATDRVEEYTAPGSPLLGIARPNPFQATTEFRLDGFGQALDRKIRIYDSHGRLVRRLAAAGGSAFWSGLDDRGDRLPAGVYFYRVEATPAGKVVFTR